MSNEGLTERDFAILGAAFEPNEIGSNGGKAYVKARAIKKRLRMIDPNYTTDIDTYVQVIGDVVTVWGGLTLKDVRHAGSKSKNVNCWRKQQDGSYTRVDEYEYARELANAIMKAKTGLLQRCAETFDVGDYLKDKSSPTPPSLSAVLAELKKQHGAPPSGPQPSNITPLPTTTPPPAPPPADPPPHWALNGDGEKIKARMNQLGLSGTEVLAALEPGKVLAKLSETALTYDAVYRKMDEIKAAKVAAELEAKRAGQPAAAKGDEPFSVKCTELQAGDLVYGLNGRNGKPARLMHYLGDTEDGIFAEWIVWSQTQFTNVTRLPFDKSFTFKILRRDDLVEPPEVVLKEVEYLKGQYAAFAGGGS